MVDDDNLDHEYLPILGLENFRKASAKLILGENSKAIAEGRVGAAQCISGTGAVYTGASFLAKHYPFKNAACYISKPTWGKSLPLSLSCVLLNFGCIGKNTIIHQ
jgi:aspartate aminotransferase